MPYEMEVVLMAKQFGVTPSQIENEEDALLYIGLEGESILKALTARDNFLSSGGKVRMSPAQLKVVVHAEQLLAKVDVEEEEREIERDYNDADLAGIIIEG